MKLSEVAKRLGAQYAAFDVLPRIPDVGHVGLPFGGDAASQHGQDGTAKKVMRMAKR